MKGKRNSDLSSRDFERGSSADVYKLKSDRLFAREREREKFRSSGQPFHFPCCLFRSLDTRESDDVGRVKDAL